MKTILKEEKKKTPLEVLNNPLYFNIDMLEIKAPGLSGFISEGMTYEKDDRLVNFCDDNGLVMEKMDEDNSSQNYMTFFGIPFSYEKIKVNGYHEAFSFSFSATGYPPIKAFTLLIGSSSFGKVTYDISRVCFYGAFFSSERLWILPFSLYDFYKKLFYPYFTDVVRIDICADYNATKEEFLPVFDKVKKWTSSIGDDEKYPGLFQTYYMGQTSNDKNHTRLIRIYDKQTDSFKKQKSFLYPHLFKNKNVQRLEIEFRREKMKTLDISALDFLDDIEISKGLFSDNLTGISSYFEKYTFPKIKTTTVSTVLKYLLPIPENYIKQYCSFISTIFNNCSYQWLCQLILQPIKYTPRIKNIDWEWVELANGEKHYGKFQKERHYKTEKLVTVIDPLAFLRVYIRYIRDDIHLPSSAINKVLREEYVTDKRKKKEYDAWFKAFV